MSEGQPPTEPARPGHLWGRRDILTAGGWAAVGGSLLAGTLAFVRLLFRRAPIEPPTMFAAGRPADYKRDSVSDRYLSEWRVFLVRETSDLYAVFARCTHLGCTPRWYGSENKFKCPCHGSGFTSAGVNFEGPAPRPLERARIWTDDAGNLWVDVSRRFKEAAWKADGAFVHVQEGDEGDA